MSSVKKSAFPAFKFDSDSYRGKDVQPSAELAERVRAAARAALKSKPIGVSTVFIDTSPHKPASGASASNFGFRHPGDRSSTSTSNDDDKDGNPLAALLTYTDDSSDSEDSPRAAGGGEGCSDQTSSKDLDSELASFMMELETSGLLKEKDSASAAPASARPEPTASSATSPPPDAPRQDAASTSAAPGAGAASSSSPSSPAPAAAQHVSDQKVLGYLVGAPAWCKVEDSGSGKIYYWNMATNDVAWDPPNNADGNDLRDTSQLASDAAGDAAAAAGADDGSASARVAQGAGAPPVDAQVAAAVVGTHEGGVAEGGSGASSDADMEDGELGAALLEPRGDLRAPGVGVEKQLAAAAADVEAAAALALTAAPAALRQLLPLLQLLVEVGVRRGDWRALEARRTVSAGGAALPWGVYEQRVVEAVGRVRGELPAAVALAGRGCRQEEVEEDGEVVAAGPAATRHPPLPDDPCLPPPLPEVTDAPLPPEDDAPTPPPPGLEDPAPTPPSSPPPPLPSDPTTAPSHHPHAPSSAAYPYPSTAPPSNPLGAEAIEFVSASLAGVSAAAAAVAAANPVSAAARATEYSGEAVLTPPAAAAGSKPPEAAVPPASPAQQEPIAAAAAPAPVGVKKVKSKKVSQMMDKWTAVSRSLEEEERQRAKRVAEDADPEALQKKRKVEIEHWKERQLLTGQADVNANFQPVHGDWRQRIKAKGSSGGGKQTASDGSSASGPLTAPSADLDALSAGLPMGWRAMREKATGDIYYGNLQTKEVTWDRPS